MPDELPVLNHDYWGSVLVLFEGGGSILVSDSKSLMSGDRAWVAGRTVVVADLLKVGP